MKSFRTLLLIPAAFLAFACNKSDSGKVDDALNNDLSLAARPGTPMYSISAAERAGAAPAAYAPRRTTTTTVRHRSSSSSSGTTVHREPTYRVEKNTRRDAAIGAAAGAVIGATTSRNKVKGGIIGAAAGGILGAVIGNNVDKKKVPQ